MEIREFIPNDESEIEKLYPAAFPEEALLPLVRELLGFGPSVLSLVAVVDGTLAGHVAYTTCTVSGSPGKAALLGPLAVAPAYQGRGIGSALVRAGFEHVEAAGAARVFVLGDPNYYGRFGFKPGAAVAPPRPVPDEWRDAWQWIDFGGAEPLGGGQLEVPEPWRDPALWGE